MINSSFLDTKTIERSRREMVNFIRIIKQGWIPFPSLGLPLAAMSCGAIMYVRDPPRVEKERGGGNE